MWKYALEFRTARRFQQYRRVAVDSWLQKGPELLDVGTEYNAGVTRRKSLECGDKLASNGDQIRR